MKGHLPILPIIVVIGFVSSLGVVWINSAMRFVKAIHDSSGVYNLRDAITSYYTEYRKFPLEVEGQTVDISTSGDFDLIREITGHSTESEPKKSPRGIAFYSDRAAKKLRDGRWVDGMRLDSNGQPFERLDYYGNPFRVRIVAAEGRVAPPDNSKATEESVFVWSAGRDGDFDTWEDNIKTW